MFIFTAIRYRCWNSRVSKTESAAHLSNSMRAKDSIKTIVLAALFLSTARAWDPRSDGVPKGAGICNEDESESGIDVCADPMFVCNMAGHPVCELDNYESMVTTWKCSKAKCLKRWDPTGDYYACCKCRRGYYLNNPWNAFDLAEPPYCVSCSKKVKYCTSCDYYGAYNARKFECYKCKSGYKLTRKGTKQVCTPL